MKIKAVLLTLALATAPLALHADFPDSPTISLWEGVRMPGKTTPGEEKMEGKFVPGKEIQGFVISNVSKPTMQFYKTQSAAPASAVIVCPGGAYRGLQYGSEGVNIANFLNKIGVSAFILKYRVPNEFKDKDRVFMDAQRAIRLVRANATKWNIDPNKVGMIGFSAGGHLVGWMSTNFDKNTYAPLDDADKLSTRPDFAAMVYPAWLDNRENKANPYTLALDIPVSDKTPPAFIVHSEDDVKLRNASIAYYLALMQREIPVDLHLFAKAGHGYGMKPRGMPVDAWPQLFADWLRFNGFAPAVNREPSKP